MRGRKRLYQGGDIINGFKLLHIGVRGIKNLTHSTFLCPKCDKEFTAIIGNVRKWKWDSCGCIYVLKKGCYRHGEYKNGVPSAERTAYNNLKSRCYNPNNSDYHTYGALGISVCERWLEKFENFLEDMGRRPSPNHSIDRIDSLKGYSKDNCRWADKVTQARNRKIVRKIDYRGMVKTIPEWALYFNIKWSIIYYKIVTKGLLPRDVFNSFVKERMAIGLVRHSFGHINA